MTTDPDPDPVGDSPATDAGRAPTRLSTAVAVTVAVAVLVVLYTRVGDVFVPALVGTSGGVGFALSLWLVGRERFRLPATVLASVLTVPVGGALLVGLVGSVLVLVSALFPVSSPALIAGRALVVLSNVGVVVGCLLAVVGVAVGAGNLLDREALGRYVGLGVRTAVVPLCATVVFAVGALLSRDIAGEPLAGVAVLLQDTLRWLLAPSPVTTHLATTAALVALATYGVRAAVGALPIAELLVDSGAGETEARVVARLRRGLLGAVVLCLFVTGTALFVELGVGSDGLRRAVGGGTYRALAGLTAADALRGLLLAALASSVAVVALVGGLQRLARGGAGGVAQGVVPFLGGGVVTAGGLAVAGPVYTAAFEGVATRLPSAFEETFRRLVGSVGRFYGEGTVVLALVTALVVLTTGLVVLAALALLLGYLSTETGGYAMGAAGLFLAAAFSATLGAPDLLVFGGLVAALLVWDAGEFATTLGREVGRHAPTARAELVHLGGTAVVGVVGVGAALALRGVLADWSVSQSPASVVALLGVLAGLVLLVAALR